jgi:hypothetical protein
MKPSVRVDSQQFQAAMTQASQKIDEALVLLTPYLVVLTEADRVSIPRVRNGFPEAGRSLCDASVEHPKLCTATDFDAAVVRESLANVDTLAMITGKVAELSQRIADSRLAWLGDSYVASLAAYGVAKVLARANGAIRTVIAPLARIFAVSRSRKPTQPAPSKPKP